MYEIQMDLDQVYMIVFVLGILGAVLIAVPVGAALARVIEWLVRWWYD